MILLWCRKCQRHTPHKFMGAVILAPLPMLAEDKKLKVGEYECQVCKSILVVDEDGQVVEEVKDVR